MADDYVYDPESGVFLDPSGAPINLMPPESTAGLDAWIDYYSRVIAVRGRQVDALMQQVDTARMQVQAAANDGDPVLGPERLRAANKTYESLMLQVDRANADLAQLHTQQATYVKMQQEGEGVGGAADTALAELRTAQAAEIDLAMQLTELEIQQAQLALAGTPDPVLQQRINDLTAQQAEANVASTQAATAAQQFENQINQTFGVTMAELGVAQAGANVASTQATTGQTIANTSQIYAEIDRLLTLLPGEVKVQEGNFASLMARAGYDAAQTAEVWASIEAGLPAAQVKAQLANAAANEATAAKTQEELRQLTLGELGAQIDGFIKAMDQGVMTPDMANQAATKLLYGATPFEMAQEANTQLNTLTANAMQAGMLVSPGTTTMDPGGAMAAQLGKLGIESPDFGLQTSTIPEWAQGMGLQTQYPNVATFDAAGNVLPGAWAGAGQGVDMSPQEYEAMVAQTAAAAPPTAGGAPSQPQAQLVAGASPPPAPAPGAPAAPTVNINVGSPPPAPPMPPPPDKMAMSQPPPANTRWQGARPQPAWAQPRR